MKQLKEAGIETRPIWKLNHTQTMYQSCQAYHIEKAPYYQNRIINLPCSVNITEADIKLCYRSFEEKLTTEGGMAWTWKNSLLRRTFQSEMQSGN